MNKLRLILFISFAFVFAFLFLQFRQSGSHVINYAEKLEDFKRLGVPNFKLSQYLTEKELELRNIESQILLINFWATWCKPCVAEFPSLIELANAYRAKDLQILAVSVDSEPLAIESFLKRLQLEIPSNILILRDPQSEVAYKYGTAKIPETYIVNRDKKLISKVLDAQDWTSRSFREFLDMQIGNIQ